MIMRPWLALVGVILFVPSAYALDAGLSAGTSLFGEDEDANSLELRLRSDTLWQPRTWLQLRLEGAVGALESDDDAIWRIAVGPTVSLRPEGAAWQVEVGVRPTYLGDRRFGEVDLGGRWQFDSHLGLRFDLGPRASLAYRIQHISNADLYDENPGLNMQSLELGYRF